LSDAEYEALRRLATRPNIMRALTLRARIVLECATGKDNAEVAKELGVSAVMVGRSRRRFVQYRMKALTGSIGAGRGPPGRAYHLFRVDPLMPTKRCSTHNLRRVRGRISEAGSFAAWAPSVDGQGTRHPSVFTNSTLDPRDR
jgi:hypothetical protein